MASNLYSHQSENVRKTWLLMAVFLAIIVALAWFLSYYYNDPGILYIGLIFSMVMNIGSFWFSDKMVLKIAGAKPVKREEYFDLYNAVENLAITAGLPTPKIYVIPDPAPNAFATGRDKNHAVVAVTTGLLATLNKTELEGVIAHELAHIGNRDILLQTVVVVLVGFITLVADMFLRSSLHRSNDRKGNGALLIIGIIFMVLSPIIASLIQLAISRKREFLADATGAMLTRYPEGLASALEKISASAVPMQRANHATAHLFISNPFAKKSGSKISFFEKMFMTHPPTAERVAALRGINLN
jgi:heat shock protein HtpX